MTRIAAVALILGLLPGSALAQGDRPVSPTPDVAVHETFDGVTRLGTGDSIRVAVRVWSLGPGRRVAAPALPFPGTAIAELRAGSVTTVIGGRRVARRAGDLWIVPDDGRMELETPDNKAVIAITLIGS